MFTRAHLSVFVHQRPRARHEQGLVMNQTSLPLKGPKFCPVAAIPAFCGQVKLVGGWSGVKYNFRASFEVRWTCIVNTREMFSESILWYFRFLQWWFKLVYSIMKHFNVKYCFAREITHVKLSRGGAEVLDNLINRTAHSNPSDY